MKNIGLIFIPAAIFFMLSLFVFSGFPVYAEDVSYLKQAGPPKVTDQGIVFTYQPQKQIPKYVIVSGDFDNWQDLHLMTRNHYDVFFFVYNKPGKRSILLNEGKYRYRFLVDGIWMNDPNSPGTVYDARGTKLSFFEVKKPIVLVDYNPVRLKENVYVFYYKNSAAKKVNLIGDFNNWNPYSLPMKKDKSGYWEIEVDIPPGLYAYQFIVDGKYIKDPLGQSMMIDRFDYEMSLLDIPGR